MPERAHRFNVVAASEGRDPWSAESSDSLSMPEWAHGHKALAERMYEVWRLSGRADPFDRDMEGWRAFALGVQANVEAHRRKADVCACGAFVLDSSGDAGCGNCGADLPPESLR